MTRAADDSPVLELAQALIARESVTPNDAGCLELISSQLEPLGFRCQRIDRGGVSNLLATVGASGPHLAFAGHTDVVPTGPVEQWLSPPFEPTIRDGYLYGRGAADMKSSLAAMVLAAKDLVEGGIGGQLSFLLTSDEEGPATDGTVALMEHIDQHSVHIDYCLVGEPSSRATLGDVARCGRRGSLNGELTVNGVQGHVAYPEQVRNPIHAALPALAALASTSWDRDAPDFPHTSFQIANLNAGTGASNVVPGQAHAQFNFRYNPAYRAEELRAAVEQVFEDIDAAIDWSLSGEPFYTAPGVLRDALASAIYKVCGLAVDLNTAGGTSDGRFIAPRGIQVVEFGPVNDTIHQLNERVAVNDLEPLRAVYRETVLRCLNSPNLETAP